jgi:hypothetical protein
MLPYHIRISFLNFGYPLKLNSLLGIDKINGSMENLKIRVINFDPNSHTVFLGEI